MSALAAGYAVFVMIGAGALVLFLGLRIGHRTLDERFAETAIKIRAAQRFFGHEAASDANFSQAFLRWTLSRVPALDLRTPAGQKLQQALQQAGYFAAASARLFQAIRLLCSVCGAIAAPAAAYIAGATGTIVIAVAPFGAAIGFFSPGAYLRRCARERQAAIAAQLSDVLDLLVICVEAGLGILEAIKLVGTETGRHQQAIGRELALVASAVATGATLGQALHHMAERSAIEELKPLAATLIQGEQLGAPIAPALRSSSDTLRTARRLRAEEAAQKTSVKILFPLVLFILPAMLMVIVGPAVLRIIATLAK